MPTNLKFTQHRATLAVQAIALAALVGATTALADAPTQAGAGMPASGDTALQAGPSAAASTSAPQAPPLVSAASPDGDSEMDSSIVIARVGDRSLTFEDLWEWVRSNPNLLASFGVQAGKTAALHSLINATLAEEAARQAFPDLMNSGDPAQRQQAFLKLRRERVPVPSPNDLTREQLKAYYDDHIDAFGIPPMARTRELFFQAARDGSLAEARRKAQEVYEKLEDGVPLAQFAPEHAPDFPSKQAGGDMGFRPLLGRPKLTEVVDSLEPNQISEPVDLGTGIAIVQLLDRRNAVPAPFEAVLPSVRQSLIAAKRAAAEATLFKKRLSARALRSSAMSSRPLGPLPVNFPLMLPRGRFHEVCSPVKTFGCVTRVAAHPPPRSGRGRPCGSEPR